MRGSLVEIDSKTAVDFLLPRHYSGRTPNISKAFGWYDENNLVAVCTFGKPASPPLCVGICGKEYAHNVYELNRLCRIEEWKEPLSEFVAACLRNLKPMNWIIVSYSDTAMNHHGYIYIKPVISYIQGVQRPEQTNMCQMGSIVDITKLKIKGDSEWLEVQNTGMCISVLLTKKQNKNGWMR